MTLLQVVQRPVLVLDGIFELLDVLGLPLSKCSLGLTVSLLAFLGGGIYLETRLDSLVKGLDTWFGSAPAFVRPFSSAPAKSPA